MSSSLPKRLVVEGVHGRYRYDVDLSRDVLIIVGDNGSGKTTLLNILFFFISGQWDKLADLPFERLTAAFDKTEICITAQSALLSTQMRLAHRRFFGGRSIPPGIVTRLTDILIEAEGDAARIQDMATSIGIPLSMVDAFLAGSPTDLHELGGIYAERKKLSELVNETILYFPTYRRIEQELKSLYPEIAKEPSSTSRQRRTQEESKPEYVEFFEFGMMDVETKVNDTMNSIRQYVGTSLNDLTLKYLGEILDVEYDKVDMARIREAKPQTIDAILSRIEDRILSSQQKLQLKRAIEGIQGGAPPEIRDKVIAHYFLKLLAFHQQLQKREEPIRHFVNICNDYMNPGKRVDYAASQFKTRIVLADKNSEQELTYSNLSSGEKQIVSLFSHLFLSGGKKFVVIIDEPELSLSLEWQRRFLKDIWSSGYCNAVIAVTHSPFIYDNELDRFARGMETLREVME